MNKTEKEKLLQDQRVIEEIHRHLWIESEKVGYDITFAKAAEDWMKHFSGAWMKYHGAPKKDKKSKLWFLKKFK